MIEQDDKDKPEYVENFGSAVGNIPKVINIAEISGKLIPNPDKDKGQRFNADKTRYDLLEPFAVEQVARIFTKGAKKYAPHNWMKGMAWSKMIASLKRHLAAFEKGEDYDFDPNCEQCKTGSCVNHTGELHIAQVAWNALGLTSYYRVYPQGDDRLHSYLSVPKYGLDIDEVICDWVGAWTEFWGIPHPKNWFFDRDIMSKFEKMRLEGTLDDFYLNLEPKISPDELPFEPHCYVTSRPVDTKITEEWLDKHGFPARPVYTVPAGTSKVDIIRESGVEIFVDDRFDNFQELNKAGICTFLYDSAHNQRYDVGYKRIKSLKELLTLGVKQ